MNRGYAVNGLNQYTSAGPATFSYDANGNLTGDGTNGYTYDVENRLVSVSNGTSLRYDPLGRLWEVAKAGAVTRFLYDGDQLTAEYDGSGNLLRRYVHGDGEDDPQVWYEGAGTTSPRYLYADHQGSVVAVADAGGNAIAINAYDEYGIPKVGNVGRFQYTGQAWLAELGLYYYKARVYSPTLGRFLQTDPIGYDDQVNLYAYVANDPVNGRDPDGKQAVQAAQAAARACASNATCSSTVAGGVATLAAAIGIELSQRNDNRDRINVDTNVLINVLDNPASPSAASANSILAGKVANVSITAANEYITGSEKTGVTPDMAKERLGAMVTSGRAEIGPSGGIAGTAVGMMKGLSMGDASIIAAGKEKGIPTLTQDRKMLKIEPENTIRY